METTTVGLYRVLGFVLFKGSGFRDQSLGFS